MTPEKNKRDAEDESDITAKRARESDDKEIKDVKEVKKAKTEKREEDIGRAHSTANPSNNKVDVEGEADKNEERTETKGSKTSEDSKGAEEAREAREAREAEHSKDNRDAKKTKNPANAEDSKDSCTEENHGEKKLKKVAKETVNERVKDEEAAEENQRKQEKPSFVFGASSSFGSGFNVTQKKLDGGSKKDKPQTFAFGSGLSFGNGFGVLKKSDTEKAPEKITEQVTAKVLEKIPERTPELSDSREKSIEKSTDSSASPSQGVVKLQKQDVKSGEEAEETLYQANAKLYQFTDIKTGWKERGIGVIKVNKNVHTGKARLVMRSRGMLKVILNLSLVKGFTVQKGFVGSMQGEKFIRMITQDDNKAPIQTAVKTGKREIAEGLYDSIVKQIPK
ncbi:uncharacterized protein ZBAI_00126 [Zygosaccharomyces bailii ISA1307]|nr:uncharacterized protein ZBAI_00126 [Zygosaccharomyces bailii ISA1307]